jgi:hypothetical protein
VCVFCFVHRTAQVAAYLAAGAGKCVEGGKLTPSRNLALDLAAAAGKLCVRSQISLFEKLC